MMVDQHQEEVSIFHYSPKDHCFSTSAELCLTDRLTDCPSSDWLNDHNQWLITSDAPSFDSIQDLHLFNQKGVELSQRLQEELPHMKVAPFQPLYDKLLVSCDWWHLKDEEYGFPVSVQKLPVSNDLKADFMLWRHKKDDHCLAEESMRLELEKEGQDLQKRLYEEMHQEDEEADYVGEGGNNSQSTRSFGEARKWKNDRRSSF
mmetsp:Transcript_5129/g.8423  ORF Transcript_5129/g.8423 Transcript_5129/m.8423 type:complete len:204 (+) Transcript_5129:307-918(+)